MQCWALRFSAGETALCLLFPVYAHDEAIKRENTEFMAKAIPGAGLLIEPEVSHFSFLQDPQQFTGDVLHFLEHAEARSAAA